jgi:amicyanin
MKRSHLALIIAAAAIAAVGLLFFVRGEPNHPAHQAGDRQSSGSQMTGPEQQENSGEAVETDRVEIRNFSYAPSKITVRKGTTVTWTNQDNERHDVRPDNPDEDFQAGPLLARGESYSVTFNTVGTYSYFCTPHPFMKGTVEVVE